MPGHEHETTPARKQRPTGESGGSSPSPIRARDSRGGGDALLGMQRGVGNRAVQNLVAAAKQAPRDENDRHEHEADVVARKVAAHARGLDDVRSAVEQETGADLSRVRLHTDSRADALNREASSRAMTSGSDVYLRSDQFAPGTTSGRDLIAHEMTHVAQQAGSAAAPAAAVQLKPVKLSKAQLANLRLVADKMRAMTGGNVTAEQLQASAGGVLTGIPQDQHGEMAVHLNALADRLDDLIRTGKVFVDKALAPGEAALATTEDATREAFIRVRPELVEATNDAEKLRTNALTLAHELTHTLLLPEGTPHPFPIKDYGYRSGWAMAQLPPETHLLNADSYAEALSRLSPSAEAPDPRLLNIPNAQRDILAGGDAGQQSLGRAMAWADIVLNRAWIRMSDVVPWVGSARRANWAPVGENATGMEHALTELGRRELIGTRKTGSGIKKFSGESQSVMKQLGQDVLKIKNALTEARIELVDEGQGITFDKDNVLRVPRVAFTGSPEALGRQILQAMATQTMGTVKHVRTKGFPLMKKNKGETMTPANLVATVVDVLGTHDRPEDQGPVQALLQDPRFSTPMGPVGDEAWETSRQAVLAPRIKLIQTRSEMIPEFIQNKKEGFGEWVKGVVDTLEMAGPQRPDARTAAESMKVALERNLGSLTGENRRVVDEQIARLARV